VPDGRAFVRGAVALALLGAAAPTSAADGPAPPSGAGPPPEAREVATLAAREAVLSQQVDAARASVRWRLRALSRFVRSDEHALDGAIRARALDAGARALARELGESRSLAHERDQLRAERVSLAAAARDEGVIGPAPALALPVPGAVLARFGVAPERATGLLVASAGVRLAASPGAAVRAPAGGVVARAGSDLHGAVDGGTVVIDAGAGWTIIVGGLAEVSVTEGARVAPGDRLGSAGGQAAVPFEVWRGRYPVDPLLVVRPAPARPAAPEPLAAPPSVP
jgi:septal ring factor EnvC (AmiA/AmiB activator)